jgi:hypothetical protein
VAESATTAAPTTSSPDPVASEVDAKVVFDGETCLYLGPLVVPGGSEVTFAFEATARPENVALVVLGVHEGTTWEEILADSADLPASTDTIPAWAKAEDLNVRFSSGHLTKALEVGDYLVSCNTAPEDTDQVYPAAMIEVIPAGIEAAVVFDGEACFYDGPLAVPKGSTMTFEFEATARPESVALAIVGITEGTTWEEIVESSGDGAAQTIPPFAKLADFEVRFGPGTLSTTLDGALYLVSCNTAPEDTDAVYPAALIEVGTAET